MSFIDDAYLEYKKNIYKPDGLGVEWLKISSNEYNRMLYEYGELHVSMSHFTLVRDRVRVLWGSVLNWLESQPPQKAEELSDAVSKIVQHMEKKDKYDVALSAFSFSIQNGRIGDTHYRDDGSYCYEALMAYKAFHTILREIVSFYEIPETERDMPLYPDYDEWVSSSIFRDAYNEVEIVSAHCRGEDNDIQSPKDVRLYIEELNKITEANIPKYEAFRKKVTSCCEVCKSLDDACQAKRLAQGNV